MATTVNVLCYKSKTLSNGEHPLMICVCKDRKRKYISIGISIHPDYWDFEKNKPKTQCPNREYIETLIASKIKEYNSQIIELKAMEKEFTANSLTEQVCKPCKPKTVNDVFLEQLQRLGDEKRTGYMLSTKQVYNSLLKFNKHLNIYFSDIDVSWLRKYEIWLRKQGIAENTIGIRFRTLRTMFNLAIDEGIVKAEYYPFRKYKVSKLHAETAKRAISKEDIECIMNYKSKNPYNRFPIDIFTFSFLMGGINFVDI